jgi:large subunit ribosomal protein L32e
MPNVGYESPAMIRGLHPSGLIDTLIFSIKDLESLDPAVHGIRISSRIGAKKRIKIVEAAFEKKFRILNTTVEVEKEEEETTPQAGEQAKEATEGTQVEEKTEELSLKK